MHDEKSTGQKGSRIFPVQKNRKDRFSLLKEADRQIMLMMAGTINGAGARASVNSRKGGKQNDI